MWCRFSALLLLCVVFIVCVCCVLHSKKKQKQKKKKLTSEKSVREFTSEVYGVNMTVLQFQGPSSRSKDGPQPGEMFYTVPVMTTKNSVPVTDPITRFSWFPGYAWSILYVDGCNQAAQIGWELTQTENGWVDNLEKPTAFALLDTETLYLCDHEGKELALKKENDDDDGDADLVDSEKDVSSDGREL